MYFSSAVHFMAGLVDDDIIYNPLPLYHTAGGMVGMGQVSKTIINVRLDTSHTPCVTEKCQSFLQQLSYIN